MSSYKDLDIYKISLELFYIVHPASLKLPKYELYGLGSQLRRSSDTVVTNIVVRVLGEVFYARLIYEGYI